MHPEVPIIPVQQPEKMDEEDREVLRLAAQLEVQQALAMRDRILTEVAASARWLQASLLVVNGGAAVAVLNSDSVSPHTQLWSCAFFVLGILLSLLTANAGIWVARDTPKKLTEFMGYWMGVTVDLLRSEEIERDWQIYAIEIARRSAWPRRLGYSSVGAFVIGCMIAGAAKF